MVYSDPNDHVFRNWWCDWFINLPLYGNLLKKEAL